MNYYKYENLAYFKFKKYGSKVTVIESGNDSYNAENNSYEETEIKYEGYALQESFNTEDINGTNILADDIVLMMSISGEVKSGDKIIFAGKTYTAVNVEKLCPDGNESIYLRVQAR